MNSSTSPLWTVNLTMPRSSLTVSSSCDGGRLDARLVDRNPTELLLDHPQDPGAAEWALLAASVAGGGFASAAPKRAWPWATCAGWSRLCWAAASLSRGVTGEPVRRGQACSGAAVGRLVRPPQSVPVRLMRALAD